MITSPLSVCLSLLSVVLTQVSALRCHEGFNLTVGGIPFYFWAEHTCEKNSNCVIQEYTYPSEKRFSEISIRYGGCVSKSVKHYFECPDAQRNVAVPDIEASKNIIRGLDRKLDLFASDLMSDEKRYKNTYLSRGNDVTEFIDGVHEFLLSAGYSANELRSSLYGFADDIKDGDTSAMMMSGYALLRSLKSEHESARTLSKSLRQYIKQQYDGRELSLISETIIDAVPKVLFPILQNWFPGVDESYEDISNSIDFEFAGMGDDAYSHLLLMVTLIQSLISELSPDEIILISESCREIVKTRTLASGSDDLRTFVVDGFTSFTQNTRVKCSRRDAKCIQKRLNAFFEFYSIPFQYRSETSHKSRHVFLDSVSQLMIAYIVGISEALANPNRVMGRHYDFIMPKIEKQLRTVVGVLNDPTVQLPALLCRSHHCETTLCNAHKYLVNSEPPKSILKTEL